MYKGQPVRRDRFRFLASCSGFPFSNLNFYWFWYPFYALIRQIKYVYKEFSRYMIFHEIIIKLFEDTDNMFDIFFKVLCVSERTFVYITLLACQRIPGEDCKLKTRNNANIIIIPGAFNFVYSLFFTVKKTLYLFSSVSFSRIFVMVWIIVQKILIPLQLQLWAEKTFLPCWYWA